MNNAHPESFIEDILKEVKTIAVVGASSKKDRDSYKVMQSLIKNGYRVFPINPNESGKTILNQECLPTTEKKICCAVESWEVLTDLGW